MSCACAPTCAPRAGKLELHPLVMVANLKLVNARDPEKPLSLEVLTQWLGRARRFALPQDRSDEDRCGSGDASGQPRLCATLSHPARRGERDLQVVFATSEPFETRWIADIGHLLRSDIQRVVANPLDVGRYLTEWWSVQRSIQRAARCQE